MCPAQVILVCSVCSVMMMLKALKHRPDEEKGNKFNIAQGRAKRLHNQAFCIVKLKEIRKVNPNRPAHDDKSATDSQFITNAIDSGRLPEGGSQEGGFDMDLPTSITPTATECKMANTMAQCLEPSSNLYANPRLIQEEVLAHKGETALSATYQGDGYAVYQNILCAVATLEIQKTKAILGFSSFDG